VFEVALIVLLVLLTALAARLLRTTGPVAHWVTAWCAAAIAGLVPAALPTLSHLQAAAQPFGTFCAALLLSGTLALAQRPVPRWWLPAALGFGLLRSAVALQFGPPAGYALALLCEPFAVFGAAFVAFRLAQQGESSLAERLLAPAMLVLAVAGVLQLLWLALGGPMLQLVPMWIVVAPLALGVQIQATANRLRRALRRGLEERVAARTLELAASEERYRTISELSSDFAFKLRIDRNARLTHEWTAGAFEATLGWRPEDVNGHGWLRLLEPGAREQMTEEYRRVKDGKPVALERRLLGSDGEPRWIQLRLARVQMDAAGCIEVLGSARDVTELKRAEQESERLRLHVEQVQRLESLGILAGGIAHDFNNLLTVIRSSARLALDELPIEAPARARVARIAEAAQHAASLTNQMLTYAGKSSPQRTPLDLGVLVASMTDLLRASLSERCELVFELSAALPSIEADASGIRQVLLNLVLNASEAQRDLRMRIVVRTALVEISREELRDAFGNEEIAPGAVVELSVSDDGCGMDAATAARVFEPFFTTKFSGRGRGLGMAAVLGVVQAHGGAICVESELARGTRVRALFPLSARRPAASVTPSARAAQPTGGTVLIVDDDEGILEVAGEVIARAGFRVLKARGGCEALDRVREVGAAAVDAVVLDLAMPDMSGEETFLRLRELRGDLPVILVSGYDAARVADRFAARGLDAFLGKPWEPEELVATIRQVLRR
jgi:PAS domain S-box-containing protein